MGKILITLNRISAWILFVVIILYIVTGFGMTRQIIDPVFARYLHTGILPYPLFIFFGLHMILCIKNLFQRLKSRFKND